MQTNKCEPKMWAKKCVPKNANQKWQSKNECVARLQAAVQGGWQRHRPAKLQLKNNNVPVTNKANKYVPKKACTYVLRVRAYMQGDWPRPRPANNKSQNTAVPTNKYLFKTENPWYKNQNLSQCSWPKKAKKYAVQIRAETLSKQPIKLIKEIYMIKLIDICITQQL